MKINPFLQCLSVTGIDTGISILGAYSFSSGDNLLIFNQLLTTGANYFSGIPYDGALPLIYNGAGNQPTGSFNSSQFYQISNQYGKDFSSLIYLNYSGCTNSGSSAFLLASTVPSPTGSLSGVYLGITPSSRLFVKSQNFSYTIPKEIGIGDFAYFNVTNNRFINFGLFSISDDTFYGKGYDAGTSGLDVKDLCFGGALNYPPMFTGYSGKINEIYLFNSQLDVNSLNGCIDCVFATGTSSVSVSSTFYQNLITGSYWTGIQSLTTTGYQKVLSPYLKQNGATGFVYLDSGVFGNVVVRQSLIPLTQSVLYSGFTSGLAFLYNDAQRMSGVLNDFYFDLGLTSGDFVEVYSYPSFNNNIALGINSFQFPVTSNDVQIFANGLAETRGADYSVAFNNLIVGFDTSDVLMYDTYSQVASYPYATGIILTGASSPSYLMITGVKGTPIDGATGDVINFSSGVFNYDIFLNGQKMASGINYSYSGSTLTVSGNDLTDINDPNLLEIKFISSYSGAIRKQFQISGNQSYVSGLSGFSEQIWVNGARQRINMDYFKAPRCSFCTGQFNVPNYPFSLYDSSIDTIGFFS